MQPGIYALVRSSKSSKNVKALEGACMNLEAIRKAQKLWRTMESRVAVMDLSSHVEEI